MLSSKQRSVLRALANGCDTILQVGKGGVTPAVVRQASEALMARELIKGRVLENAGLTARAAADLIAEDTGAEVIQAIGMRFVLFKRNEKQPIIKLD